MICDVTMSARGLVSDEDASCAAGVIWFFVCYWEKYSFHNSAGKNSRNLSFFPKFGNDRTIYKFFEKNLSSSCSSRHQECIFDTPGSKIFPDDKTFFCSKVKEINKYVHFSAKSFFLKVFPGHEKCKLDNYAELNSLNSDVLLLKAPEVGQNCMLFTKIIFPRNVFWTGEKQFWQVCRNKFAKNLKIFRSKTKKIDKFVSILHFDFSWKCLMDTKNTISTALLKQYCWILVFLGSKCGKNWTKFLFFQWANFSSESFVDIKCCTFDSSAEVISLKNEVLWA